MPRTMSCVCARRHHAERTVRRGAELRRERSTTTTIVKCELVCVRMNSIMDTIDLRKTRMCLIIASRARRKSKTTPNLRLIGKGRPPFHNNNQSQSHWAKQPLSSVSTAIPSILQLALVQSVLYHPTHQFRLRREEAESLSGPGYRKSLVVKSLSAQCAVLNEYTRVCTGTRRRKELKFLLMFC